ncbi:MAG TPA: DUF4440 domain-containing protein [Clostridia bacterium]|nr:DUF4440 domain-containing protein [Clostridia bacterium]
MEPHDPAAADPDFRGLELALAQRRPSAVAGGFEALIDEAFVEFGASGRLWDRPAVLALLAEPPRVEVMIDRDEVVRLADDVRLVTYRATLNGRRSLRSSIWVRRDGRWRLRFHQGTRTETWG